MDDMFSAYRQNLSAFEDMSRQFRDLFKSEEKAPEAEGVREFMDKSSADFQKYYRDLTAMFGMVPREEHQKLIDKHEKLKQKCGRHEETIRHLHALLKAKSMESGDMADGLQEILKDQGELFQGLMNSFGQYLKQWRTDANADETGNDSLQGEKANDENG